MSIDITKPFMPPREEYEKYLDRIWESEYVTNDGPLVKELENKLKDFLDIDHMLYVANGTLALQLAIKALGLKGEVITTPFSYVATTSSMVWEGCEPIFVDIDPNTLNINHELIEDSITDKTSGIIATHVFGNPCNVEAIEKIARKHKIKLIYDGAHCFDTKYKQESIFQWGDISITSFHATKIFHTAEGGGIYTSDKELYSKMEFMRKFGHDGPEKFNGVGINAKNTEFHAAIGLSVLNHMDNILERRKKQSLFYDSLLNHLPIIKPTKSDNISFNYAYYPIIFDSESTLLRVKYALEEENIYPRRYFYPSLSKLPYLNKQTTPVSDDISKRILCLPLYHKLNSEDQTQIVKIIEKGI